LQDIFENTFFRFTCDRGLAYCIAFHYLFYANGMVFSKSVINMHYTVCAGQSWLVSQKFFLTQLLQ